MNAVPRVLRTAFQDGSMDKKVTVMKTKDDKVALEVSCSIVACNLEALLDPEDIAECEMDLKTRMWIGHEFVLDSSSDCLKILFHKMSIRPVV